MLNKKKYYIIDIKQQHFIDQTKVTIQNKIKKHETK